MKKLPLILLVLFLGCTDPINEIELSFNESVTNLSKIRLAQNDLRSILSSSELKITLPEFLGSLKIENNLIYEQHNDVIIGWTPILGEGKTSALILSIGNKDSWEHKLIIRGKLPHYYQEQPNSQGLPLSSVKQIFQFYDNPPQPRKKSETQSQGSSETTENTGFKFQRNQNIKNGWNEECAWHLAFRYTPEVGDVDYYEFYYICEQVYVEETPGDPINIDENSGGGSNSNPSLDLSLLEEVDGKKPLKEYASKCVGLNDMWNSYPNNEVSGYITSDGKVLLIDILASGGGTTSGLYEFQGKTYYPYAKSLGAPAQNYAGMIIGGPSNNSYYLIPVTASIHTHSPCRSDGTNGVSHNVGSDDKAFALKYGNINHWAIGCGAVGQFNGVSDSFFNKKIGNIDETCNQIN